MIQKPTIHSNGTSAAVLLHASPAAAQALNAVLDLVRATVPNGLDYYPQGGNACHNALAEHDTRVAKLRQVLHELEALMRHCEENAPFITRR